MIKKLKIILFALLTLGCGLSAEQKAEIENREKAKLDSLFAADVIKTANQEAPVSAASSTNLPSQESVSSKTIHMQLQGRWQSADDPLNVIQFKDQYYTEFYGDRKGDENKYGLQESCEDNAPVGEDYRYLTIGGECQFYVIMVNESRLELSFVGRGNTLTYTRM